MAKPNPQPCRPTDHSKFEIVKRDGRARIGRFHTNHGVVTTPALLPVINPNLRTIPPREMWNDFGVEMLITNSYIIQGKQELKDQALSDGVHNLLDFPGAVMTDSGTFQSYVYGEIEINPEEIVEFQRDIGTDVATMLDVFGRPDMSRDESAAAVEETASRAEISLLAAGETMLNGPIQGGLFSDLRAASATAMATHGFAVHPIGGIVPLMEQRHYRELVNVITSCRHLLPPQRPVHLFGCGHPHLFPLAVALGVDLFDSAAYALFARDNRLIAPWGTLKLADLEEWPISSRYLSRYTPNEVRDMDSDKREGLLARANLEVTLTEISRVREAVRKGRIWELVERKASEHPALQQALALILDSGTDIPVEFREWLLKAATPYRRGGVLWSPRVPEHPWAVRALEAVSSHWSPPDDDAFGYKVPRKNWNVIVINGISGPWRERCGNLVKRILQRFPSTLVMVQSPLGLVPYSLEDLNPFSHFTGPQEIWNYVEETLDSNDWLTINIVDGRKSTKDALELLDKNLQHAAEGERPSIQMVDRHLNLVAIRDKLALFTGLDTTSADLWLEGCNFVMSGTGRVKNVLDASGIHILSPRLTDGGLSLTLEGARHLHAEASSGRCTIPVVVMDEDSAPYIMAGRNAMHGFVIEVKGELTPGMPCLIESHLGKLLAHGISRCTNDEILHLRKGIALNVKAGVGG